MYKHQLPQLLILLSSLLLCMIGMPESLHSAKDTERGSRLEKAATDNQTEDNTTEPHYYIRQLHFEGNKHLNGKRLTTLFGWQAEKAYSQTEIREGFERILDVYRTGGFVFTEMTPDISPISENETHVSIAVKITEGKQIRIGILKLTGNQRFSEDEIRDELGLKPDKLFTEAVLTRGIERVQTLYSENGYPKVEIEPKDIEFLQETATVDFQLHIREGSQIQIGAVKVSGLQKTKTEVVLREISVKPHQRFDQRNIDASYHRLRNLGYFYQVNPNVLEAGETADKINFHAQVTEAKTG